MNAGEVARTRKRLNQVRLPAKMVKKQFSWPAGSSQFPADQLQELIRQSIEFVLSDSAAENSGPEFVDDEKWYTNIEIDGNQTNFEFLSNRANIGTRASNKKHGAMNNLLLRAIYDARDVKQIFQNQLDAFFEPGREFDLSDFVMAVVRNYDQDVFSTMEEVRKMQNKMIKGDIMFNKKRYLTEARAQRSVEESPGILANGLREFYDPYSINIWSARRIVDKLGLA